MYCRSVCIWSWAKVVAANRLCDSESGVVWVGFARIGKATVGS